MKLGQGKFKSQRCVVINEGDKLEILRSNNITSTLELIQNTTSENLSKKMSEFKENAQELFVSDEKTLNHSEDFEWLPAIDAPEVWAVGVTYKRQAKEHDDDIKKTTSKTDELYSFVYENERAEVFFKGFHRTVSGPNQELYLRNDSQQVLPEAESVIVLGKNGKHLGFTYGNDLTAWDIEKECPLYLNQAKIWTGSAGVGQYIIPYESFKDPYDFTLHCRVERKGEEIINSTGSTRDLKRSYEELIYYLNYNNIVPAGTLLFTGTACIIPHDFCLEEGDIVTVEKEGFGQLVNTIKRWQKPEVNYTTRA